MANLRNAVLIYYEPTHVQRMWSGEVEFSSGLDKSRDIGNPEVNFRK